MKTAKKARLIEVYIDDNGVWRLIGKANNYLSVRIGVKVPSKLDGSVNVEVDTPVFNLLERISDKNDIIENIMLVQHHKDFSASIFTMSLTVYKLSIWRNLYEFSIQGEQVSQSTLGTANINNDKTAIFNKQGDV